MSAIAAVNDLVIRFANVNGTGSASANGLFAKACFRMGIPVTPKNVFPSNIQGLPTWYEVRVSEQGYLGRREGIDFIVCMNGQSLAEDIASVRSGGYVLYDNSKPLDLRLERSDVNFIGIPLAAICREEYPDLRRRQLMKNVIYIGALAALLDIEFEVLKDLIGDQFRGKDKLIAPNIHALEMGYRYAHEHFDCPLALRLERRDLVGDKIMLEGNVALGIGSVYAGATVVGWYPITPSTSVIDAFEKYANRLRIDAGSGEKKFAIAQAEDELAAMGIVIGASWNGARAFTATSGPGVSLMSEFLGLAYFAEVPVVLFNIQRAGPSTGMPTRTQQSDIFACAYASHGDTKQLLLFPEDPRECFDMAAESFDLAERLQTPVIVMSDLDLGMNEFLCEPLVWDDERQYDRGKVFNQQQLEEMSEKFGRYRDSDGDGIPYRTYPGTHPDKGAFFTRGTSRDPYAVYTEKSEVYVDNMERLLRKWESAKQLVPEPQLYQPDNASEYGLLFFGTSTASCLEARDLLQADGFAVDCLRVRAFPFNQTIEQFIADHRQVFVVEQNRDGQLRKLLVGECDIDPKKLISVPLYDGMPITARQVIDHITATTRSAVVTPLRQQPARG